MHPWATLTSNGAVKAGAQGILHSVILTAGSDAASVTLKDGGASGTVIAVLKAAAGATVTHTWAGGLVCYDPYATITGTSPTVTVEYS